jgi:hypothetical protein
MWIRILKTNSKTKQNKWDAYDTLRDLTGTVCFEL